MKRIRLNTLFSVCLFILLGLSFIILFINSYSNYKKVKSFTLETFSKNIKKSTLTSFTEEITHQANSFNHQFLDSINIAKEIETQASLINRSVIRENNMEAMDLKYNKKTDCYSYINKKSFTKNDIDTFGFIALAAPSARDNKLSLNAKQAIIELYELYPLLKKVVLNKENAITTAAIIDKENVIIAYCASPYKVAESVSEKNFLNFNDLKNKFSFTNKNYHPVFECWKSSLDKDLSLIFIYYPVYDKNGKLENIILLALRYNLMWEALTNIFTSKTYKIYKTTNLVISNNGQILHLTKAGHKLLGLPENSRIQDEKMLELNIKLTSSDNKKIRDLTELFKRKKSGQEYIYINNEKYLIIFNNIPTGNWTIVIFVKTKNLYKPVKDIEYEFEDMYLLMYKKYFYNFLIILILGFIVYYILFKYVFIKPIEALREQVTKIGRGNFNLKVKEFGTRELHGLSKTFNNLGERLSVYTDNLRKEVETRQTIETELKIAGALQQSLLPKITSEFIENNFEIYPKLIPAKEMSGDFYDFYYLNDRTLVLVLADVSGKGITAAFYMSMAKAIIRETCLANRLLSPGEVFNKVNRILCKNNESCMFLTAYLIYYDIPTGKIQYANAGHHEFIYSDSDGKINIGGILKNLALGMYENAEYKTSMLQLNPGQFIIFYTDGIIEAPDDNNNEYGLSSLKTLIENNYRKDIAELGDLIIKDTLEFEKSERFDDITILLFKRKN